MITWEDLQQMAVPSIRSKVKGNAPQRKELKGAKFEISQILDKEIYIIDWLFLDKGVINKERELIKLQFYYNGILGVVYTSAEDIIISIRLWQEECGGEIKPIKDTIYQDGMSYRFKDISMGETNDGRKPNIQPPVPVPEGICIK